MASLKKQNILESLSEFLKNNSNFTFIRFEKTTHSQLETLRKSLKKEGGTFKVVKNSLLEKAINRLTSEKKELKALKEKIMPLKNNTAIVSLGKDWSRNLKTFFDFSEKEKTLAFKVGILDDVIYMADEMTRIAKLPSKDQLYGQLIFSMKSPANKLVYAMKYNINKLVYVLTRGGETKNG